MSVPSKTRPPGFPTMAKLPPLPAGFQLNPKKRSKPSVRFRFRGKYCAANKADRFEVWMPDRKKPILGVFPASVQKSKKQLDFVQRTLVEWTRLQSKKRAERDPKRLKKAFEKKKKKPVSKRAKKVQAEVFEEIEEAFEKEKIRKDRTVTKTARKIAQKASVTEQEEKYVYKGGAHHQPRHRESREGLSEFNMRYFQILKQHVDFDPNTPVEVRSFDTDATALALREYFRPHAEKFLDQVRLTTENAFILRVKTKNRVEGEKPTNEGIGTERFRVRDHIAKRDYSYLKDRYPGLTKDQILRELQIQDLNDKLKDLFQYFVDRYQDYLSKKVISSLAVTGFTMEVVKGGVS